MALCLGLTPVIRALALRLGVVDHPERRKMHHVPVPLLGGAAIIVSFLTVVLALRVLSPGLLTDGTRTLPALLTAGLLIGLVGAWDDWKGLRAPVKFAWQVVAAGIVVFGSVDAQLLTNPLGGSMRLGWLGAVITILWIVGVTNAVNLIDGLDGLAAGIVTIAGLSLCGIGALTDEQLVAFLSLTLAGAALGFLPYNTFPARIFLGDTGSMFMGFILASLGAVGTVKASTTTVLVLPIVVLGIPVFDTVWAILRRTHRKVSPFTPDRDHLHHRLVKVGLHHRHVVLVLYFVSAFLGLSAFIMVQLPYQTGFLFAGLLAMGGALGVWTLKYIEENVEQRVSEANGGSNGAAAAADSAASVSQGASGIRGRKSDPAGVQILVCEVGVFGPSATRSPHFASVAREIREVIGRRLKIYDVGVFMNEERWLLIVLRLQPVGHEGTALVRGALLSYFGDTAQHWGGDSLFPEFRWLKPVPERSGGRVRLPGVAAL